MSTVVNILLSATGGAAVVSAIDKVRGSMGSLATTILGVGSAAAGLESGLDLGGRLSDLSNRTRETVRNLVVLERGLDNSGIGAGNLTTAAAQLARAISGLNEMGESTREVFARLNLSPEALKVMGLRDQLQTVTEAFANIENPAERAALAMKLFGRNGAEFLQLFSDPEAFSQAEKEVGRLGDRLQASANRLDALGDRLKLAKSRMQEFWVVAAEKLAPTLEKLADAIESINPGPVAALAPSIGLLLGSGIAAKAVTSLDSAVLDWATRQGNPIGQAFAGSFLAPLTGALAKVLPIGLAAAVAVSVAKGIIDGITQWKIEQDNAEIAAANAAAKQVQAQRDQLRNARDMAEVEATRKKLIEEIAALEAKAATKKTVREMMPSPLGMGFTVRDVTVGGLSQIEEETLAAKREALRTAKGPRMAEIIQQNQDTDAGAERLAKQKAIVEELTKQAAEYQKAAEAGRMALASDEEKLRILDDQEVVAAAQLGVDLKSADAVNDQAARAAAVSKYEAATLDIAKQRRDTEQSIADKKKQQAEAEKQAAEKAKQAEIERQRLALEAAKNKLEDRQSDLQLKIARLEGDFTKTDAEKWQQRKGLLEETVKAAQAYLDAVKKIRDAAPPETAPLWDANVRSAQSAVTGAQSSVAGVGPNPASFAEQLTAGLKGAEASIGTFAQAASAALQTTIGGAVTSLSGTINGFLTGTIRKGDILRKFGVGFGQSMLQAISDMGAKWILQMGIMVVKWAAAKAGMFAIDVAFSAKSLALSVATAAKSLIAWLPAAIAASISSFGVAAAIGVAAVAALLATKAFAGGGPVSGPGGGRDDKVLARVSNGEWIAPEWMTRDDRTAPLIGYLEAVRTGSAPGYSLGGFISRLNPLTLHGLLKSPKIGPAWMRPENFFGTDEKNPFWSKAGKSALEHLGYGPDSGPVYSDYSWGPGTAAVVPVSGGGSSFGGGFGGAAAASNPDMKSLLENFAGRITLINVEGDRTATRVARHSKAAGDIVVMLRDNRAELQRRGPRRR